MKTTLRVVPAVLALVGLLAVGVTTSSAQTVIISDTFASSGALNGKAPDTDTYSAVNWTAGSDFTGNPGTYTSLGGNQAATLAFVPTSGNVYTLTLTVTLNGAGSYFWAGFSTSGLATQNLAVATDIAGIGVTPTGGVYTVHDGSTLGGNNLSGGPSAGTQAVLKLVLDTTGASWKASYFVNNTQFGSIQTLTATSSSFIAMGGQLNNGTTASLSSITLTTPTATPEPSTWAMLIGGLGLFALVFVKRAKKASLTL